MTYFDNGERIPQEASVAKAIRSLQSAEYMMRANQPTLEPLAATHVDDALAELAAAWGYQKPEKKRVCPECGKGLAECAGFQDYIRNGGPRDIGGDDQC